MEQSIDDNMMKKYEARESRNRVFLFTALYIFFFAGAFYGWGPMQVMLETHGAFSFKCKNYDVCSNNNRNNSNTNNNNTTTTNNSTTISNLDSNSLTEEEELSVDNVCPQQTSTLVNIQLVSSMLANLLSPLLGEIADRFGAPSLMNFASIIGCISIGLLTISTSSAWTNIENLLWIAFPLLGLMSFCSSTLSIYAGMVFGNGRTRNRVIAILNSLFDGGGVTYLILWRIQVWTGTSLPILFGSYFVFGVICLGGSSYFWQIVVPVDEDEVKKDNNVDEEAGESSPLNRNTSDDDDEVEESTNREQQQQRQQHLNDGNKQTKITPRSKYGGTHSYIPIANRSTWDQLRSQQFLLLTGFFSFYMSKDMMAVTTAKDFLAYMGDDKVGNRYLAIYTLMMPASIVGLPFVDWIMHRYGFGGGFQTVNILSLAQGIVRLSARYTQNLNIQVIGFIFHSFVRCFVFSVTLSYLPTLLAPHVTGKGNGIIHFFAGIIAFINIPLSNWAIRGLGGDFFYPNLIYESLTLPWLILVWIMDRHIQKEKAFLTERGRKIQNEPLVV